MGVIYNLNSVREIVRKRCVINIRYASMFSFSRYSFDMREKTSYYCERQE